MILLKTVVILTSYISLASAFYPFVPTWMCKDDGLCAVSASKRSADHVNSRGFRRASLDEALTFELRQRTPDKKISQEEKVGAQIRTLTQKYASRAAARDAAAGLNSRGTNTYNVVIANTPAQANSIALHQDGTDFSYFCTVNFGSKAKPMYMLMDTGASATWVMGDSCKTDACSKHNSFGSADSATYKATTQPFAISYGSGVVNGSYASDTVALAGMTFQMTFGTAQYTSADFLSFPMDGIMGLGRGANDVPTFLQTLTSAKLLKANIFGININRNSDGTKDGVINFGAPDTTKYTGSLGYTPVTGSGGDWVLPVDDVAYNNKKAGTSGKVAYIDTGTSFVFIPPDDAKKLFANIPGAAVSSDGSTYTVPCDTKLPIQFIFSGVGYNVAAKDWVGGPSGSGCVSNIYAKSLVGNGAWLLGDTFLKNVYAVFDIDQNRIGFGAKGQTAAASISSGSASPSTSSLPAVVNTVSAPSTSSSSSSGSSKSDHSTTVATSTSTGGSKPSSSSTSTASSSSSSAGTMPLQGGHSDSSSSASSSINAASSTTSPAPAATTTQGSAAAPLLDTRAGMIFSTVVALLFSV